MSISQNYFSSERRAAAEIYQNLSTAMNATYQNIDFDTERPGAYLGTLSSQGILVSVGGTYLVGYSISIDSSAGSSRSASRFQLTLNNVPVPGSESYAYHRLASVGEGTASKTILMELTAGDVVRAQGRRHAGNAPIGTIPNASNLFIAKL